MVSNTCRHATTASPPKNSKTVRYRYNANRNATTRMVYMRSILAVRIWFRTHTQHQNQLAIITVVLDIFLYKFDIGTMQVSRNTWIRMAYHYCCCAVSLVAFFLESAVLREKEALIRTIFCKTSSSSSLKHPMKTLRHFEYENITVLKIWKYYLK